MSRKRHRGTVTARKKAVVKRKTKQPPRRRLRTTNATSVSDKGVLVSSPEEVVGHYYASERPTSTRNMVARISEGAKAHDDHKKRVHRAIMISAGVAAGVGGAAMLASGAFGGVGPALAALGANAPKVSEALTAGSKAVRAMRSGLTAVRSILPSAVKAESKAVGRGLLRAGNKLGPQEFAQVLRRAERQAASGLRSENIAAMSSKYRSAGKPGRKMASVMKTATRKVFK